MHALLVRSQRRLCCRNIVKYIGYGHDKPGPTDTEVTAKPTLSAYIVTENLECGTLRDLVLNQVSSQYEIMIILPGAIWMSRAESNSQKGRL